MVAVVVVVIAVVDFSSLVGGIVRGETGPYKLSPFFR
jgi:hypothetical protein